MLRFYGSRVQNSGIQCHGEKKSQAPWPPHQWACRRWTVPWVLWNQRAVTLSPWQILISPDWLHMFASSIWSCLLMFMWGWVKTLVPSEPQNSWDLWMFIPLKCIYRYWPIPMSVCACWCAGAWVDFLTFESHAFGELKMCAIYFTWNILWTVTAQCQTCVDEQPNLQNRDGPMPVSNWRT